MLNGLELEISEVKGMAAFFAMLSHVTDINYLSK